MHLVRRRSRDQFWDLPVVVATPRDVESFGSQTRWTDASHRCALRSSCLAASPTARAAACLTGCSLQGRLYTNRLKPGTVTTVVPDQQHRAFAGSLVADRR